MKKRMTAGLLTVCMIMGSVVVPMDVREVSAEETVEQEQQESSKGAGSEPLTTEDGFQYAYQDTAKSIIQIKKYTGNAVNLTVPSQIDGVAVTSIAENAFQECNSLVSVTISSGITSVGTNAFRNCSHLEKVFFSDTVSELGTTNAYTKSAWLFYGCSKLKSIEVDEENTNYTSVDGVLFSKDRTKLLRYPQAKNNISYQIPEGVTSLGTSSFYECGALKTLIIPEGVTALEHAIESCANLQRLEIAASVTKIKLGYSDCGSLKEVVISSNNPNYAVADNVIYTKDMKTLVYVPGGKTGTLTFPSTLETIGQDTIDYNEGITSLVIPASVTEVENDVLCCLYHLKEIKVAAENVHYCAKDDVLYTKDRKELLYYPPLKAGEHFVVPNEVTCIWSMAFAYPMYLKTVTIPNSVTQLGYPIGGEEDDEYAIYEPGENITDIYAMMLFLVAEGSAAQTHMEYWGMRYCTGHDYTQTAYQAPTCTAPGFKTNTCNHLICKYSYTENIAALDHAYGTPELTKATTKKDGKIVTKCSRCGHTITKAVAYPKTIAISTTKYTYNGKVRTPSVTVKDSKGAKLKKGTDYTVSYSKGRKKAGKYTVTIQFKGNYSGTAKKTFTIIPKSTNITKITSKKKAFTLKWKKQTSQTNGYQIQYSTNSKFTKKTTKSVTITKNKTTSKKISKLKAKKKYYVRIRTYKTVKVNGKDTKIYSNWSKVKNIKTKK